MGLGTTYEDLKLTLVVYSFLLIEWSLGLPEYDRELNTGNLMKSKYMNDFDVPVGIKV